MPTPTAAPKAEQKMEGLKPMGQQQKKSQRAKLDQHLTNMFGGRAVHAGDGSGDPVLSQGGAEGQQRQGEDSPALPPNRPSHVDVAGWLSRDWVDIIENHVVRVPDDHTQLVAVGRTQREVRHMLSPPPPARAGQACTGAVGLEPSWHCGPLPGSSGHTQPSSLTAMHKAFPGGLQLHRQPPTVKTGKSLVHGEPNQHHLDTEAQKGLGRKRPLQPLLQPLGLTSC